MLKFTTISVALLIAFSACKSEPKDETAAETKAMPGSANIDTTIAKPAATPANGTAAATNLTPDTPAIAPAPVKATDVGAAKLPSETDTVPTKPAAAKPASATKRPTLALIPIRNAKISQGVLVGGHPTSEQITAAAKSGYKTIINMQMPSEAHVAAERVLVKQLGMTYISIPIAGAAGMTEQNARAFAKALTTAKGPTMVHCASGNRVGALYGLKAFYVDKRPAAEAFALAKAAGMTSLTEVVRKILKL